MPLYPNLLCVRYKTSFLYLKPSLSTIAAKFPFYGSFFILEQDYFGSDAAGLSGTGVVVGNGRRTRYKAGPKNGTNENGRSQEPLSYLE